MEDFIIISLIIVSIIVLIRLFWSPKSKIKQNAKSIEKLEEKQIISVQANPIVNQEPILEFKPNENFNSVPEIKHIVYETFYAQVPINGVFELESINNFDTLYQISICGNEGEYEFIANNKLDLIASNLSTYIDSACEYSHFSSHFIKIKTQQKGKIMKINDKWKITQKSKIEFIV